MAGKMESKFVALASVAVGVVYAAGYVVTASSSAMASAPANIASHGNASANQVTVAATSANKTSDSASWANTADVGTATGATNASKNTSSSNTSSSNESSGDSSGTAKSTATASKPSGPPATQKWLDGTYNGSGSNRIGTIAVAVTVKGGKISDVQITQCDTHYPEEDINPVMPQAVLQQQQANVGYVSGATLSSMDFMDGVNQALTQAQNPNYKG